MRLAGSPLVVLLLLAVGCASEPLAAPSGAPSAPRTLSVFEQVRISSDELAENVREAHAPLDWGDEPVAAARLTVELASPCYPFEGWAELEIPEGHSWPLLCDAFDRALTVSLDDPVDAPEGAPPGLELVRAITPFGGPLTIEADVTDVVNGLPGAHRLRIAIGTWGDPQGQVSGAKGEWIVSARVTLSPGPPPRSVLAVVPLVFTSQTELAPPPVAFTTPEGASRGRLEYRATGHGSAFDRLCRGPAEEFCARVHALSLDGAVLDEFTAWRDDCGELCTLQRFESAEQSFDYCAENPCGAPASVRAPRANWCPGSVTAPRVLESAELGRAGEHLFASSVSELTEGGSWLVSAVYFAFE